ncbi:MAG: UbiA family prenyltransferase [Sphingomonadaceae bacterium]
MNFFRKAEAHRLPLVVDLDGTLSRSDLLVEAAFAYLGRRPFGIFALLLTLLLRGKAAMKAFLADAIALDASLLPYDDAVIAQIETARATGRKIYLISASNEKYVRSVAEHLGIFDAHAGSTAAINLSGKAKAAWLEREFGEGNFDYIGNSAADLPVWRIARSQICIRLPGRVARRVKRLYPDAIVLPSRRAGIMQWLRLMRVHQWSKNVLVAVALFTAHKFDLPSALHMIGAFLAFSLCASSVYIVNDQIDLADDRAHRSKRFRPLAAGIIDPLKASAVAIGLFLASVLIAVQISMDFLAVLLGYFALTTAYSLWLKRKMLVDVVTLGMLYTIRIFAGAVAIDVPLSEWLLAFSMFIFLSLALVKRYVELSARLDSNRPDPANRNYKLDDLTIVAALAAAAGFNAITVLALWISSPDITDGYAHPKLLWLVCPLLMYWIARVIMMAHRRLMHDDPIVFAMKDWNSLLVGGLTVAIMGLAI